MAKKTLSQSQLVVRDDIMRYKKNKLAGTLALIGLAFNCLYFMILYALPNSSFFNFEIGVSVLLTLVLLLAVFLSSEAVKGYNKTYSIVLFVIAAFQILRIFGYPLDGLQNNTLISSTDIYNNSVKFGYFGAYFESSEPVFAIMVVYLVLSAVCLIASGVWGWIVAERLTKYQKAVDSGEIVLEDALKQLDAEDEAAKAAAPVEAQTADSNQEVENA